MTIQEKRFLRRELINWHLQNNDYANRPDNAFRLHDLKFLVRNGEVYRYGVTLAIYSQYVTYL